ncbi:MAG: polyhydroxyalkanoate biosynthesis repressor PhaR, partial [Spirochaetia bacterium]|nr:polyhydroxyalkanoate biosynthesis repressor PhaR [Spirochaetia bacterium]
MKLIKRYANRRLYDAETSTTITLEDVAECIRAGKEVRVVDNLTGEDITAKVLGQTFLKVSLEQQNLDFSTFLLTALIREVSTNVSHFLTRMIQGGIGAASLTKEKLDKIVQTMVEQGDLQLSERSSYVDQLYDQLRAPRPLSEAQKAEEGIGILRSEMQDERDQ